MTPPTIHLMPEPGLSPDVPAQAPARDAVGIDQTAPVHDAARFVLAPVLGLGAVDGAWWPRSLDAEEELRTLLAALTPSIGRPTRVSLNLTAWDPGPRWILLSGRRVHLGWFTHMDPAVITIAHMDPPSSGTGRRYQKRVRLLVIPRETGPEHARVVMDRVASGTATGTPTAMLANGSACS